MRQIHGMKVYKLTRGDLYNSCQREKRGLKGQLYVEILYRII